MSLQQGQSDRDANREKAAVGRERRGASRGGRWWRLAAPEAGGTPGAFREQRPAAPGLATASQQLQGMAAPPHGRQSLPEDQGRQAVPSPAWGRRYLPHCRSSAPSHGEPQPAPGQRCSLLFYKEGCVSWTRPSQRPTEGGRVTEVTAASDSLLGRRQGIQLPTTASLGLRSTPQRPWLQGAWPSALMRPSQDQGWG